MNKKTTQMRLNPQKVAKTALALLSFGSMVILQIIFSMFSNNLCSIIILNNWIGKYQVLFNSILCIFPSIWLSVFTKFTSIRFMKELFEKRPKTTRIVLVLIGLGAFVSIIIYLSQIAVLISMIVSAQHYTLFLRDFLPSGQTFLLQQGIIVLVFIIQASVSSAFCWIESIIYLEFFGQGPLYMFIYWGIFLLFSACQIIIRKKYLQKDKEGYESLESKPKPSWNPQNLIIFTIGMIRIEIQKNLVRNTIIRLIYFLCIFSCTNAVAQLGSLRMSLYISIETLFFFVATLFYADLMRKFFFSLEDAFNTLSFVLFLLCLCNLIDPDMSMIDSKYFHIFSIISGFTFAFPIILPQYFEEIIQRQRINDEIKEIVNSLPFENSNNPSTIKELEEVEMIRYRSPSENTAPSDPNKSDSWDSLDQKSSLHQTYHHQFSELFSLRMSIGLFFFSCFLQTLNIFKVYFFTSYPNDMLTYGMNNKSMSDFFSPVTQVISSPIAILSTCLLRFLLKKQFYLRNHSKL